MPELGTAKNPFEYVAPTPESVEKIKKLREYCHGLNEMLLELVPNCRERSVAITRLEELSMWANKAVVFTQVEPPKEEAKA